MDFLGQDDLHFIQNSMLTYDERFNGTPTEMVQKWLSQLNEKVVDKNNVEHDV